tara:strand:+ start:1489 stop:2103 length:615 start_codon:yes stop_codon:yes gene_type:complete
MAKIPVEKDIPKEFEQYYKKRDKLKKLLETHERTAGDSYNSAVKEVLGDDIEELDDDKKKKEFAKHIHDSYYKAAKEALHADFGESEDEIDRDMLTQAVMKSTKAGLLNQIDNLGSDYTRQRHGQTVARNVQTIDQELTPTTFAHLDPKKHGEKVVTFTKSADKANPKLLEKGDIADLLNFYDRGKGAVTHKHVRNQKYYIGDK